MTKYRLPFVTKARDLLRQNGIDLDVVYGQPAPKEVARGDSIELDWGTRVTNRYAWFGGKYQAWMPLPSKVKDSDLFIVTQANRIWSNYPLLLKRELGLKRVAYWGHGINFQSVNPHGLKDRWKRLLLTRVDWWFAYTGLTEKILVEAGYPHDRITCLNNSIDTVQFRNELDSVPQEQVDQLRATLSIPPNACVGLLCGSLYPDKRLEFLVEACDFLHDWNSNFRMIIIGDGPSGDWVRLQSTTRPWLHVVGVKYGLEKAVYFQLADLMLNPGLVGLHILDAFAAGLPMVTTADAKHSPEIAYLEDGHNGFITPGSVYEYAQTVISVLEDRVLLSRARDEATKSGKYYTIDGMADNFAEGVRNALALGH